MKRYLVTYTETHTMRVDAENEEALPRAIGYEHTIVEAIEIPEIGHQWTIGEIVKMNRMAGGSLFDPEIENRKASDYVVLQIDDEVYIRAKRQLDQWRFDPESGRLDRIAD